jgi:hypothetical protein
LRVVLIGLILAGGWMLVGAYREMFHEPAQEPGPAPDPEPIPPPPGGRLLLPGAWSLSDSPWRVQLRTLARGEATAALRGRGEAPAGSANPLERRVLAYLRRAGKARPEGGLLVWEVPLRTGRVRAVVQRLAGEDRLRLVQATWPAHRDHWSLLEAAPSAGPAPAASGAILPLPPEAVLARRWEGERLAAVLAGPVAGRAEWVDRWRQAGWSVTREGPEGERATALSCRRGERDVLVWALSAPDKPGGEYLLLIDRPGEEKR